MEMVYICDTQKNTTCRKTNCHENGGPCYLTTEEKYELLGEATEAQKECLQKQEQLSLAFEKLSISAGEMSKALEEAGKRMEVGFASGFSIGENRELVRYGGPVKTYVEPYADTTWGEYMTGEKPPEQKRTRCAYCGVISEKDYGTCEHCGAPL